MQSRVMQPTQALPQHGVARTRAGRIHSLAAGPAHSDAHSQVPLVLLHSNGCSAWEFDHNFERLGAHRRVLAWDMPGHGESDAPSTHLSIADYSEALLAWLDSLGIEHAVLLGTSVGGSIAAHFAATQPARVAGLVLAETPYRSLAAWRAIWTGVEHTFAVPQQSLAQITPRFRRADEALLARWNIDRAKVGGWRMVDVMVAIAEFDLGAALARIQAPTLLLFGDKGPVLDALPAYRAALPSARVEVMPDCGHFPMIDDPAAFDALVLGFLDTLR